MIFRLNLRDSTDHFSIENTNKLLSQFGYHRLSPLTKHDGSSMIALLVIGDMRFACLQPTLNFRMFVQHGLVSFLQLKLK